MASFSRGQKGPHIQQIQLLLARAGYPCLPNGEFDDQLHEMVRDFQQKNGLLADGVIGGKTLGTFYNYQFKKSIKEDLLEDAHIYPEITLKKTIYLHHTVSDASPVGPLNWWKTDKVKVATAFIVGGMNYKGNNVSDGVTYRAFDERFWAHHLGLKIANNTQLNQDSIGIELCSLGFLIRKEDGTFRASFNEKVVVPEDQVVVLEKPWRGQRYFHKYSEKQLAETERLLLTLAKLYAIPLPERTYDINWFDIQQDALKGTAGLWTHVNVRKDKTDCFPQPELIAMLSGLHEKHKTFEPELLADTTTPMETATTTRSMGFQEEDWLDYVEPLEIGSDGELHEMK